MKKRIDQLLRFVDQSFRDFNNKVSSKRLALFSAIVLLTYVVLFHSNENNAVEIILELVSLIATLAGVSVYGNIKTKKDV